MTTSLRRQGLEQQDEGRKGGLSVVLYDPSAGGGVCHYTYNLAEGLIGMGCRVTLLTSHGYELTDLPRRFKLVVAFKPGWIRAIRSALRGRSKDDRPRDHPSDSEPGGAGHGTEKAPRGASRLHRLRVNLFLLRAVGRILAARSRIVHIQWSVDRDQDLRLVRLLKGLGIRTVYTAHNLMPHGVERPGEREAFTELYRTVDQVVVFAENTRGELIDSFGIAADRVCVIPHGSDSSLFPEFSQESARSELGIGSDRRVVLFFATSGGTKAWSISSRPSTGFRRVWTAPCSSSREKSTRATRRTFSTIPRSSKRCWLGETLSAFPSTSPYLAWASTSPLPTWSCSRMSGPITVES